MIATKENLKQFSVPGIFTRTCFYPLDSFYFSSTGKLCVWGEQTISIGYGISKTTLFFAPCNNGFHEHIADRYKIPTEYGDKIVNFKCDSWIITTFCTSNNSEYHYDYGLADQRINDWFFTAIKKIRTSSPYIHY